MLIASMPTPMPTAARNATAAATRPASSPPWKRLATAITEMQNSGMPVPSDHAMLSRPATPTAHRSRGGSAPASASAVTGRVIRSAIR
jgi:hypothetical protein